MDIGIKEGRIILPNISCIPYFKSFRTGTASFTMSYYRILTVTFEGEHDGAAGGTGDSAPPPS
jgi:hypothetical protein